MTTIPTATTEISTGTFPSSTAQPSLVVPWSQVDPNTSLSPLCGARNTQVAMQFQPQYMYQISPLPVPSVQGMQTPRYPSQTTDNIMGGTVATSSSTVRSGKPGTASRLGPQATTCTQSTVENERDRASKRTLEHHPSVASDPERVSEEGLYDASGLSTSQRVMAFLSSNSEGSNNLSTSIGTEREPPVKKKAYENPKEQQRTDKAVMVTQQGLAKKIPVPNESYFPVPQLLPLQVSIL